MDKILLLDAVRKLNELGSGYEFFAASQAVSQYNALLAAAKTEYQDRPDIQSLQRLQDLSSHFSVQDSAKRLLNALELRPPASIGAILEQIRLPPGADQDLEANLAELRYAATMGLAKTTMVLCGSMAEALLLTRHPDATERGPGLKKLVEQAQIQKLFGRDTQRQLETLVEYRDVVHPRAQIRNRTQPNAARIEAGLTALKLLCAELEDVSVRYT